MRQDFNISEFRYVEKFFTRKFADFDKEWRSFIMTFFVSAVWIILGFCLFFGVKTAGAPKTRYIGSGSIFMILGIVGVVGSFLQNEKLILAGAITPCAILMIVVLVMVKSRVANCKTQINAMLTAINSYSSTKGVTMYAPIFRYVYNGNQYEIQSPLTYSKKKIMKKYVTGQPYLIYIDANHPERCIDSKKISVWYYISALAGFVMLGFCVWAIIY